MPTMTADVISDEVRHLRAITERALAQGQRAAEVQAERP
jgi:hypothetical protein